MSPCVCLVLERPRPRAYLDTSCEDAGGHLLVEAGVLLTVGDEVSELGDQQQVRAVFVQSLHQSLFGPQTTHHHRIVFVQGRQPVQEADKQLDHLNNQSQEVNTHHKVGLILVSFCSWSALTSLSLMKAVMEDRQGSILSCHVSTSSW